MTDKRLVVVYKPEGKAYEGQETRSAVALSAVNLLSASSLALPVDAPDNTAF